MGKLNSLIKFVVVNANVLLFLGGIGIIVAVSLVLTADFTKLAEVLRMYMYAPGGSPYASASWWESKDSRSSTSYYSADDRVKKSNTRSHGQALVSNQQQ